MAEMTTQEVIDFWDSLNTNQIIPMLVRAMIRVKRQVIGIALGPSEYELWRRYSRIMVDCDHMHQTFGVGTLAGWGLTWNNYPVTKMVEPGVAVVVRAQAQ